MDLRRQGLAGPALNLRAGRDLLLKIDALVEEQRDIALETTLSGGTYAKRIPAWRKVGYFVTMYYLRLSTFEESIGRVRQRVAAGGHAVPEVDLRRRFQRSLAHFQETRLVVDKWHLIDGTTGELLESGVGESGHD